MKLFWALRATFLKIIFPNLSGLLYIGKPTYLKGLRSIKMGKRVRFYPHARIEVAKKAQLSIGSNVSSGQGLHLICENQVDIGKDTLISSNVFISDTDHRYDRPEIPVTEQGVVTLPTKVGRNNFIGAGVCILPGSQIGDNCIIAAHSVVKGDIPAFSMVAGAPAKVIKRFDEQTKQWN